MRKIIVMHEVINIIHKNQIHRLLIKYLNMNCHTNECNFQKKSNACLQAIALFLKIAFAYVQEADFGDKCLIKR